MVLNNAYAASRETNTSHESDTAETLPFAASAHFKRNEQSISDDVGMTIPNERKVQIHADWRTYIS